MNPVNLIYMCDKFYINRNSNAKVINLNLFFLDLVCLRQLYSLGSWIFNAMELGNF